MELHENQQIGALTIERELGRGAFGVVWLARDTLLERPVALKVLTGGNGGVTAEQRQEMLAEARVVGNLKSPHVVRLYRLHEQEDGALLQEMEYVDGGSLEDRIGEDRALPPEDAFAVFRGLVAALASAHANRVIHGDVKPANVLFGGDGIVKLTDFGLARTLAGKETSEELHGQVRGSPYYMAPEVITGRESALASDVWSAAVVLHRVLTGRLPFPAETFGELAAKILREDPEPPGPDVPAPLAELLARCLDRDADARPAPAEILEELDRLASLDVRFVAEAVAEPKTNLRTALTSFVGRGREVRALVEIVAERRAPLLTITGPGGMGKTRISQEICRRVAERLPGGAWFADLSEVTDATGIALGVADALGVAPAGQEDPVEEVARVLEYREPLLLVLDNFEQILPHAAATVGTWIERAPQVRFLVTSRALLALPGETRFELPALPSPASDAATAGEDLEAFDGVRLFVARAREADPNFALDGSTAADVARIVRELEGIPLAIELAAARARIMRPKRIAEKLGRKFDLLKSARLDVSVRQKTLEGAIDWSFDLLDEAEKETWLQAACFRGGFTLPAAESVIHLPGAAEPSTIANLLRSLKGKSVVTAREEGPEVRLRMYRAIREYGERKWRELADLGRQRDLASRHTACFLSFADRWNAEIPGPRDQEALDRLALETGNLTAVADRAIAAEETDVAARAVLAFAEVATVRRPPGPLAEQIEELLAGGGEISPESRIRLLTRLSVASRMAGEWDRAVSSAAEAVSLARAEDDARLLAGALLALAEIRRNRGELPAAKSTFAEAEETAGRAGSLPALASAVGGRGMVLGQQGQYDEAFSCFRQAQFFARQTGDHQTLALHIGNEGVVHEGRGQSELALACHREAEDLARRLGNRLRTAVSLGNQANILAQIGDLERALARYREAEAIVRELGAKQRIAQIVGNRGAVQRMAGDTEGALVCYAEAEALSRELGDQRRLATTLGQRGRVLDEEGRIDEALRCFEEAAQIGERIGDRSTVARNRCDRGVTLSSAGRTGEARAELVAGLAIYDEMHANENIWYLSFQAGLALIHRTAGDLVEAKRLAGAALALAGRLDVTVDHPEFGEDLKHLRRLLAE